jgi:AAA+ ATPase superfamily predicted ATPase
MLFWEAGAVFVGRERELSALSALWAEDGFQFVVVYGRRRVGKTALLAEFCRDKQHVFHLATEQGGRAALESFSRDLLDVMPQARDALDTFASWEKAFDYMSSQAGEQRVVVVIDEYPYMATAYSAISSILQKAIDTRMASSNIFLVLCGSSMSFMENQVLGYKSPLYGRRTAQLKVEPFDYADSALFFPGLGPEDRIVAYGATGGIPQYLLRVAQHGDLKAGLIKNYFDPMGHLFEEPANLLKQELREPAVYNSIVAAIAAGAGRLNEIATKTGEDSKKCAKYLKTLLDLRIVKRETPVGEKAGRKSTYSLSDNMFRFWYRFVFENISAIEAGLGDAVFDRRVLPAIPEYMGRVFEDVCMQYMIRRNRSMSLPIMFDQIGRWWGNNQVLKKQEEIDFIARSGQSAIFGECKWRNERMGSDSLARLINASLVPEQYHDRHYMLFSKSGFTTGLVEESRRRGDVELVGIDQLFEV